ncbi:MAG: 5-methyltetrahydropteroyltriglutamate--homocysteine S-methyltransferase [Limnochordia bacterium]|nr:5-methyltetrahydropteroyltriglutamate--homocysteine S-methyltransferase [Limnochordia bacterium]
MVKSAIVGYPRVGSRRELKLWIEDYFNGYITATTLQKNAAGLRKDQWLLQQQRGIDFIPSNDFSFYDNLLDTAYLLNVIPQQYTNLGLDPLDTYFAMARGYQGKQGDVKALALRKWFNTNYHYLVPVLDSRTQIRLNSDKPFQEYQEALEIGVNTKPVLIGPFTFLKLADCQGERPLQDWALELVEGYIEILRKFAASREIQWVQLDEPALALDLSIDEVKLFTTLYRKLLAQRGKVKILLQTYFGDIRDVYKEVITLGFDGIGLDFIEGAKTKELIQSNGFPKDTFLFAGVVNGKNIWRNDYAKTLHLLQELEQYIEKERVVLSTSCSLLHVPYTTKHEQNIQEEYKSHFAFAEEKLAELCELKSLFADPDYAVDERYRRNVALHRSKQQYTREDVRQKVAALTEDDFIRSPALAKRKILQREVLRLPILPTTTIGSFPQTGEIRSLRSKFRRQEITPRVYQERLQQKIAECIALQEEIGLDVLVHGEYERSDMVEYFGEHLEGFLFTQGGWVQSYGTRCVKPPIIWGDIKRRAPITGAYITYAQSLTTKPVKGMLTGPVTILNWSFPREDISHREMAFQIALAIKEEVLDLEAAGIKIIQIDEAALKEKMPLRCVDWQDYLDWALPAFRLVHSAVRATTQIHTHMCYSDFREIMSDIERLDADVISFEASRSSLSIVSVLQQAEFKAEVGPGVYDIHSPRVPSKEEIAETITRMLGEITPEQLWINPDCGLKTRGEEETVASLKNMVEATADVRGELQRANAQED